MRDQGFAVETVNTILGQKSEDQPVVATVPDANVTSVTAPQTTPMTTLAQDYIQTIERRFERLERSSRNAIYLIARGGLIGLGLALVFELAAMIAAHVR